MFYSYNHKNPSVKKIKSNIKINNTLHSQHKSLLNYHLLHLSHKSMLYVFKHGKQGTYNIRLSLIGRLSRLSGLPRPEAKRFLDKIISSLVNQYSFNVLYFFIKRLFWLVPVPRHKQLAYLLRALLKEVNRFTSTWRGISVTLRGKIAATGNKRKSVFTHVVGTGSASKLNFQNSADFRLLRTPTGVLGVTSIITYTR